MTGANRNLTDQVGRLRQHVEVAGLGGGLEYSESPPRPAYSWVRYRRYALTRQDAIIQRIVGQRVGQHATSWLPLLIVPAELHCARAEVIDAG
jgi:hypothetical protein